MAINCILLAQLFFQNQFKTVSLSKFYEVLKEVKIKPDKEMFQLILKEFDLIKGDDVYYEEALDLVNWRYEFPAISKIHGEHIIKDEKLAIK